MMSLKNQLKDLIWIVGLVVISRLIPHWPNVTALGAAAILVPQWFRHNSWGLFIPIIALLISDAMLGFHSTMLFTYSALFLISAFSWLNPSDRSKPIKQIFAWAMVASVSFYLITNFGEWFVGQMYPRTLSGLLQCYWMGLPFLGFETLGTVFYLGVALVVRAIWAGNSNEQAHARF
jgi:hypothetical protein